MGILASRNEATQRRYKTEKRCLSVILISVILFHPEMLHHDKLNRFYPGGRPYGLVVILTVAGWIYDITLQ